MAAFLDGKIWQANQETSGLQWQKQLTSLGNTLRYSQVKEADLLLDTTMFHICVPLNGTESYLSEGKQLDVNQQEYTILNYQQETRGFGKFATPVEGLCIHLTPKTVADVYASQIKSPEALLEQPFELTWKRHEFLVKNYSLKENSLGRHLQLVKQQLFSPPQDVLIDWDEFYYGIAEVFLETHWQINRHLNGLRFKKQDTSREIYRRVSVAHNFILESYAHSLSLEKIAQEAILSPYHFSRLYKKIYGISPYQHILQLRVERAKVLLKQDFSPTEVAYDLSFSDRRAFAKVFKRYVGCAPSKYREL
ncbi:MAG: hypothetical protein DHS20C18_31870 [Saprospiraceae bacterium]|nr:MAG: hypothetical protein DHS20C18_31870 [Saprospiraceae bacterium]